MLVIPVVVRTTENMLRLVPNSLREAAVALGTPKWKMMTVGHAGARSIAGSADRRVAGGCADCRRNRAAVVHRA